MFDTTSLINSGGLLLLLIMAFSHTGLFFCFFLPVGGFMFTTGVLIATGSFAYNIIGVCGLLVIATAMGNLSGYWFGRKTGPLLYKRKDSRFFRQQHLQTAGKFYHQYGALALAAGLFLPLIRTFAPVVAGMIGLNLKRFLLFTTIGTIAYVLSFVFAGYLIGSVPALKPYLKYLVTGVIVLVTVPIVMRIVRAFRKNQLPE
jgi:membrane-associated protein